MGAWNELYFNIFQYNWFCFPLLFGTCKHIVLQRHSLCKNVKNPQERSLKVPPSLGTCADDMGR